MHIPDGFLSTTTWLSLSAVSAAAVIVASGRVARGSDEKRIPLMGVAAAFIFAAQMLNVPVAAGTSGHFSGGLLAAVLLGPFTGMLIMTAVLIVQCFLFQDGGITALGANVFNMAIAGSTGAFLAYRVFRKPLGMFLSERRSLLLGAAMAAWLSVVIASSCSAVELAVSGRVHLGFALPAMAGVHAVIGIGEGIITYAVLSLLWRVRPDLLTLEKR